MTDCVPWVVYWKLPCLLSMREECWLIFIVQCITSTQRNENRILHTFMCGALYYQSNLQEQALRWSFAGVCCFSAWRVAAVLRMSMTGSGAPVLCTQNPQPLQQLFQPQAKRRSQDRRNKEGLLQPLESENKRDRYLNCVCVYTEAPKSIKSLIVWHLKCFNLFNMS